jgi:hypothetical protein
MNCGFCGRPVPIGQPICEGCRKARNRSGARAQRRFDREDLVKKAVFEETKTEDEDASAVWANE